MLLGWPVARFRLALGRAGCVARVRIFSFAVAVVVVVVVVVAQRRKTCDRTRFENRPGGLSRASRICNGHRTGY